MAREVQTPNEPAVVENCRPRPNEEPLAAEASPAGSGDKGTGTGAQTDDDEPVGYGRPPRRYQFKPGHSGHPKGRPKSARGLKSLLREELGERVRVTENGKTRSLSKMQLVIKRLVEKAAKGDPRSIGKLIELNISVFGIEDDEDRSTPLTADEEAILRNLEQRRCLSDAEAGRVEQAEFEEPAELEDEIEPSSSGGGNG